VKAQPDRSRDPVGADPTNVCAELSKLGSEYPLSERRKIVVYLKIELELYSERVRRDVELPPDAFQRGDRRPSRTPDDLIDRGTIYSDSAGQLGLADPFSFQGGLDGTARILVDWLELPASHLRPSLAWSVMTAKDNKEDVAHTLLTQHCVVDMVVAEETGP